VASDGGIGGYVGCRCGYSAVREAVFVRDEEGEGRRGGVDHGRWLDVKKKEWDCNGEDFSAGGV